MEFRVVYFIIQFPDITPGRYRSMQATLLFIIQL